MDTKKFCSPTIDPAGNFFYGDGSPWSPYIGPLTDEPKFVPDEDRMIAELLLNEVLFSNSRPYVEMPWSKDPASTISKTSTIVLFCGCNDLFYWACSDSENVSTEDLPILYEAWKADKKWGSSKWCCFKRNQRPQKPIIRDMRVDGAWCDKMEALPE